MSCLFIRSGACSLLVTCLVVWATLTAASDEAAATTTATRELLAKTTPASCQILRGVLGIFKLSETDGELYKLKVTSPPELEGSVKRLELAPTVQVPSDVQSADIVSVTVCEGDQTGTKIIVSSVEKVTRGRTSQFKLIPTTGSADVIAVPVEVCNVPTISKTDLESFLLGPSSLSSVNYGDYVNTCSHGKYILEKSKVQVLDTIQLCASLPEGWSSTCDTFALGDEVAAYLTNTLGIDLSGNKHIMMFHGAQSDSCAPGEGVMACIENQYNLYESGCYLRVNNTDKESMLQILMHEMGHNFGLSHAFWGDNQWLAPVDMLEYGDLTAAMGLAVSTYRQGDNGIESTYYMRCHNAAHSMVLSWSTAINTYDTTTLPYGLNVGTYRLPAAVTNPTNVIQVTNGFGHGTTAMYINYRTVKLPYESPVFNDLNDGLVAQNPQVMVTSYQNTTTDDAPFTYRLANLGQGDTRLFDTGSATIVITVLRNTSTYADIRLQIITGGSTGATYALPGSQTLEINPPPRPSSPPPRPPRPPPRPPRPSPRPPRPPPRPPRPPPKPTRAA